MEGLGVLVGVGAVVDGFVLREEVGEEAGAPETGVLSYVSPTSGMAYGSWDGDLLVKRLTEVPQRLISSLEVLYSGNLVSC